MSNTKVKLQTRNSISTSGTSRPKNIYQLDNLPRQARECELNYHTDDFSYEDLLNYAEILNNYSTLQSEEYSENDMLVKAVLDLEESIHSDGDGIDVNNFVYMGGKEVIINESTYLFSGAIFSYNMSFVDWEIPKNIKIGLSKVFIELFKFYGSGKKRNRYDNGIKFSFERQRDIFLEEILMEDGEKIYKDYKEEFAKYQVYCKKIVAKTERYAKEKFSHEFYMDNELKILQEDIEYILQHDISKISSLRTDNYYNAYGEGLPVDCMLLFTFHDFSENMDKYNCKIINDVVNEANECGGEMLYGKHKITKDSRESLDGKLVDEMRIYEKKLNNICGYLTEKYNYE